MRQIDFRYDLLPLKNRLFRLALRITLDHAEAEDIVEDTLLRVWSKRDELEEVENLEAYCLTVCRNLALDRSAKMEAQNVSLDAQPYDTVDLSPDPQAQMEQAERLEMVKHLFSTLPERQRTVLQLRDIEGKSVRETADIMQTTEENIKVMLHRARQALRQRFLAQ